MEIFGPVQEQVHPGNGRGRQVLFLPVELAEHQLRIPTMFLHVVESFEEHAPGAAGRVIDGFPCPRGQQAHHQRDDRTRRIEFSGLFVGQIREFLDQVFIGVAEDIGLAMGIAETQPREVLDEVFEQSIGQAILIRPLCIAKDAMQRIGVGLLNATHGLLQRIPNVRALGAHLLPVTPLRHLKSVVFGELGKLHIALRFFQGAVQLLIVDIGQALEEEQGENVRLEVRRVDGTPQDIGGFPKMDGQRSNIEVGGLVGVVLPAHADCSCGIGPPCSAMLPAAVPALYTVDTASGRVHELAGCDGDAV